MGRRLAVGRCRRVSGFTMVELVTVMVILGILSIGTVRFIGDSSQGFASTISRGQLAGDTRFAVERLARDVRNALPNSVRVAGSCLEYVPVSGASRYVTLPLATPAISFQSVPLDPLPLPAGARVAVYPDAGIYSLGSTGVVSPAVVASAPGAGNIVTMSFGAAHRFPAASPAARYFVVTDPVSFCVDGGALYRYTGYGFLSAQPATAALPGGLPGRALVAEQVDSPAPFQVSGATLSRNAVVEMNFIFARGGDQIRIEHAVQVRNVP